MKKILLSALAIGVTALLIITMYALSFVIARAEPMVLAQLENPSIYCIQGIVSVPIPGFIKGFCLEDILDQPTELPYPAPGSATPGATQTSTAVLPSPTRTPTRTATLIPSPTSTGVPTSTNTATSVPPTNTSVPTATNTPTVTRTSTPTEEEDEDTATPAPPTNTPSVTPTPTNTQIATVTPLPSPTSPAVTPEFFVVNSASIELFDQIPDEYLLLAGQMLTFYQDRSVGDNVSQGLNCLTATEWWTTLVSCRRDFYTITESGEWLWKNYTKANYDNQTVPARILFDPDPVLYDRRNWIYQAQMGEWDTLAQRYIDEIIPEVQAPVMMFQHSYLNVDTDFRINNPDDGFFSQGGLLDQMIAAYGQYGIANPVVATTSLSRSTGADVSTEYNDNMREYASTHGLILFDMADIESHTDLGAACFDNRDDVVYCNNGHCENHPSDGLDFPAICQDWTTETDGGHLGSVSGGNLRLAKAYWILMARIAGWNPDAP